MNADKTDYFLVMGLMYERLYKLIRFICSLFICWCFTFALSIKEQQFSRRVLTHNSNHLSHLRELLIVNYDTWCFIVHITHFYCEIWAHSAMYSPIKHVLLYLFHVYFTLYRNKKLSTSDICQFFMFFLWHLVFSLPGGQCVSN